MKYIKKFTFFLSILFLILFLPVIRANPISPTPQQFSASYLTICIFFFFGTVACEFVVGYFIIHKARENKSHFLKLVLIVNAITFPITQMFVYFFALITLPNYLFYIILLIEIIVIVCEWLLITLIFERSNIIEFFGITNSRPRLFLYSVIANMITYLLGLIFVYLWGVFSGVYFGFFY